MCTQASRMCPALGACSRFHQIPNSRSRNSTCCSTLAAAQQPAHAAGLTCSCKVACGPVGAVEETVQEGLQRRTARPQLRRQSRTELCAAAATTACPRVAWTRGRGAGGGAGAQPLLWAVCGGTAGRVVAEAHPAHHLEQHLREWASARTDTTTTSLQQRSPLRQ